MQVDMGELLGDEVRQTGFFEPLCSQVKTKPLKRITHVLGERPDVGVAVLDDVVLIAHQLLDVELRDVVEELLRFLEAVLEKSAQWLST